MIRMILRWKEQRRRIRFKERHFRAIDERMERRRRRLHKLGGSNIRDGRRNN